MTTFLSKRNSGPVTLKELTLILEGHLEEEQAGDTVIHGIAPIPEAREGEITFLAEGKYKSKYQTELATTRASAVIASEKADISGLPAIRFKDPYIGLARALRFFHPEPPIQPGIHPTAFVHEEARVSPKATIGPFSVVEENAQIEEDVIIDAQVYIGNGVCVKKGTHIHSQVVIERSCKIGKNSVIQSGAIIGSDGFGFYKTSEGHMKVPQVGIVEIGDNVEIGANVTIDRATMGKTVIGNGTKIDNLVQIAHNVVIGKNCIIVAQVGVSGSTILEDEVTLAGQVGTVGHVKVGKGAIVAARGVVTQDVEPNSLVSGFPLKPHSEEKRIMTSIRRLPELFKTVRELKEFIRKGKS